MEGRGPASLAVDSVEIHSRQKHALLEAYLRVWTTNVAANWQADAPSLDIYDLFAGTGWCCEREYGKDSWPGTALIAAEQLKKYPSRQRSYLFLNSWALDETERQGIVDAIRFRVASIGFPRENRLAVFWSRPFKEVLPEALARLEDRGRYPNLWILDPYAASDLPWNLVREIAMRMSDYRDRAGRMRRRRPELFLNFMTSGLQRNIHRMHLVTTVLGCSDIEWKTHLALVENSGGNTLDALTSFYVNNLTAVYGRPPFVVPIPGKDGNPVSMVFLAVERDAAWHSIRQESLPHFETWLSHKYEPRKEWVRTKHRIDRSLPEGQRQSDLSEWSVNL